MSDAPCRVAFTCVQNAGRSQMSTAFAERERERRELDDRVEILTGGTHPAEHVHDVVVEVMREEGFDLSDRTPRKISTEELKSCDYVATMGCSTLELGADSSDVDVRDWALEDPDGSDLDRVRDIRDEIRDRVRALFDEIEREGVPETNDASTESGLDAQTQRKVVRERYASIATEEREADGRCCSSDDSRCGPTETTAPTGETARRLGYSDTELESVAGDANLGLGCGNPQAIASLAAGDSVLDLGSGAGFDCFLAAQEVGEAGRVIGVDMTPEMVEKARTNASQNDAENVEFRLGEIEHLPVSDESIDVIISNCVVNLSPDKPQVFDEAFRVLRPGGRLAISDVVLTAAVPDDVRADPDSVASCVAGASTIDRLETILTDTGFESVNISPKDDSDEFIRDWDDDYDVSEFLVSATITARKPEVGDE
jgi:protein-tyrosine-phosphatase/SAM-dependent methyltransferase